MRRSRRPTPTATTTPPRSRCTTRWARRTPPSLYFIKGAAANTWNAQLYVDGNAVGAPQPLDYSQRSGALTTPANGQVTFPAYTPATGAAAMNMTFNFSSTTQYGDNFGVTAVSRTASPPAS